ncbi:hypothetical protein GUJ93_ZPchr0004g40049 [Zizania palustris]|uniref:DUF6598 domain-containing protein n=1 Tax=Zizania palustris TaxID=103762 RepID=A0A8J5VMW7_ZIZPA|nr:hypothetical protein GUJ93_ZPchr0004g40049 [Zizania palustris]
MRKIDVVYKSTKNCELSEAVNVFSVKIASLDIDFQIHVYGIVLARDNFDNKYVYLFCRGRDDFQTTNSKYAVFVGSLTQRLALDKVGVVVELPHILEEVAEKLDHRHVNGFDEGQQRSSIGTISVYLFRCGREDFQTINSKLYNDTYLIGSGVEGLANAAYWPRLDFGGGYNKEMCACVDRR